MLCESRRGLAGLGSPSLISFIVSVEVRQHLKKLYRLAVVKAMRSDLQSCEPVWPSGKALDW